MSRTQHKKSVDQSLSLRFGGIGKHLAIVNSVISPQYSCEHFNDS